MIFSIRLSQISMYSRKNNNANTQMISSPIDERNRPRPPRAKAPRKLAAERPGKRKPPWPIDPLPRDVPSDRPPLGRDAVLRQTRNPQPWRSRRRSIGNPERLPRPKRLPKRRLPTDVCLQTRRSGTKRSKRPPKSNFRPLSRGWNSPVAPCRRALTCLWNFRRKQQRKNQRGSNQMPTTIAATRRIPTSTKRITTATTTTTIQIRKPEVVAKPAVVDS